MEKEMSDSARSPRTQMDMQFLEMVEIVRIHMKVRSDRAMSKVLGQHDNFISRVKTGIQSVPLSVWDTFDKYAQAHNLVENTDASPSEIARMSVETASVVGRMAKALGKGDAHELIRPDRSEKQREPRLAKGYRRSSVCAHRHKCSSPTKRFSRRI